MQLTRRRMSIQIFLEVRGRKFGLAAFFRNRLLLRRVTYYDVFRRAVRHLVIALSTSSKEQDNDISDKDVKHW